MEKPFPKTVSYYNILSLSEYVSDKYQLNLNDDDVWTWFVMGYEPNNGQLITLSLHENKSDPQWLTEMKKYLVLEFGEHIQVLESW